MNSNRIITVIAGFTQCSDYIYTRFIAENLSKNLPNFSVKKITINQPDWKNWLQETCKKYNWSHSESPLVWRETGICGGDLVYIGGLLEFKNFIKNYYSTEVDLSSVEQKALDLDYLLVQNLEQKNQSKELESSIFKITISGAGRTVCPDLVAQIATLQNLNKKGVSINLYDSPGHFFKLKDIAKDATGIGGVLSSIKIINNLSKGLDECDLLIHLDHLTREETESTSAWLMRNYETIKELAIKINLHANPLMKVIFCSMGPTCLNANALIKETKLDRNNVVVVSAHYGLELLYEFAKSLDVSIKEISCPPVWGFLGINQYVDINHIIQKSSIYVPNKRALSNFENSTLCLGKKYSELRWLFYLAFDKSPHRSLHIRKSICMYQVGRTEDFQKCKAICDLIKLWFHKDETNLEDNIITLGITSDGSFGIPKNIYFSQPVHLKILEDNSRIWVPCSEFPLPTTSHYCFIKNCILTAQDLLEEMNLFD